MESNVGCGQRRLDVFLCREGQRQRCLRPLSPGERLAAAVLSASTGRKCGISLYAAATVGGLAQAACVWRLLRQRHCRWREDPRKHHNQQRTSNQAMHGISDRPHTGVSANFCYKHRVETAFPQIGETGSNFRGLEQKLRFFPQTSWLLERTMDELPRSIRYNYPFSFLILVR